jgi:WhiB family redox-sensing transcriptional regulator
MNEALTGWRMTVPDSETVPLTLEDYLGRPEWHGRALCRGETRTFFSAAPGNLAKARAVCQGCPVRQERLGVAMADKDLVGMWGGTTEAERREMRRQGSAVA